MPEKYTQGELFPPATHSGDPISSFEAEEHVTKSGIRGKQMESVYNLVKLNPGRTSRELAEKSNLDRYQIARRMSDLESNNMVFKGRLRACEVGGRNSVTWCCYE